MIKKTVYLIVFLILAAPATAGANFTQAQTHRLIKAKALLMDTEDRSADDLIKEFEKTGLPHEHLDIYEAIAATFRDITTEYGENSPQSRERLLGKIRMNMAYFQLGGPDTDQPGDGELNRLIRRKLKKYLPKDIWDNPELFHSLE
ncbi:MAG: hypothetical protein KAS66_14255 [Candidatus Omnitrophica bacterium]|nr:hypothetical protein [Candidatus Omnitrophota bacterium]